MRWVEKKLFEESSFLIYNGVNDRDWSLNDDAIVPLVVEEIVIMTKGRRGAVVSASVFERDRRGGEVGSLRTRAGTDCCALPFPDERDASICCCVL